MMQSWRTVWRWLIIAITLWSLLCSFLGWWLLRDLKRERRSADATAIELAAVAAARTISAAKMRPTGDGIDAWKLLESELRCTIAPIDNPNNTDIGTKTKADTQAIEPSPVTPDKAEFTTEPGGRIRVTTQARLPVPQISSGTPSFHSIRVSRVVSDFGTSISEYWWGLVLQWFVGVFGLVVFLRLPWLRMRRLVESIEEWVRSELRRTRRSHVPQMDLFPEELNGLHSSLNGALLHIDRELQSTIASGEQTMSVLSGMSEGVLAVDDQQRVLFINNSGRNLLGIPFADCIGRVFLEFVRQPKVTAMIQETLKMDIRQRGVILEETLELGAIQKKSLRLRATRLFGLHGNHGALITIIDETRLQRLENMRREFTANVSHELKTPLAAIKAYAETLLMGALEDEEHSRKFVERIGEQSNRLEALIQDLLKLARLQDSPQLRSDRVRLKDVIRQSVDSCAAIGKSQGVEIRVQPISEWLEVIVDREAIATIVNNLVSNAVRYSQDGGKVNVSAECEEGQLTVEVSDTGIGIAEEEHERIFERFYRVDKARSADSGGTGLGLAIVKNLVTLLGGSIHLTSQLGQGSTFKVTVPVKMQSS